MKKINYDDVSKTADESLSQNNRTYIRIYLYIFSVKSPIYSATNSYTELNNGNAC